MSSTDVNGQVDGLILKLEIWYYQTNTNQIWVGSQQHVSTVNDRKFQYNNALYNVHVFLNIMRPNNVALAVRERIIKKWYSEF